MAHKTLIDGTAYSISGGKTLVNGTAYSIKNGKTLVGGTAYGIEFGAKEIDFASLAPGVYQKGSNFSVLVKSWDALIADCDIRVNSAGEHYVYYYYDEDDMEIYTIPSGDLIISNTVTALARRFLDFNYNITGLYVPDSVGYLGMETFYCCDSLSFVEFGRNVSIPEFGQSTFKFCNNLTTLSVPVSVTKFGVYAMGYCDHLSTIQYRGTQTQWNSISKAASWNQRCGEITVVCTDGNIIIPAIT